MDVLVLKSPVLIMPENLFLNIIRYYVILKHQYIINEKYSD